MAYTIQAIVGYSIEMAKAPSEDLILVQLSCGIGIWPFDSGFQKKRDVRFLPLIEKGTTTLPSLITLVVADLSKCAYIEAEMFGGNGTQASVLYGRGGQRGNITTAPRAINEALRWLGVRAAYELDEFDTVGLGAVRHTDLWARLR